MKLRYTRKQVERWVAETMIPGECPLIWKDWLEQDTEIERLRDAAAAVVEEWEKYQPKDLSGVILNLAVEVLRLVAGIKSPPQDGDAGDRADEAYERKFK